MAPPPIKEWPGIHLSHRKVQQRFIDSCPSVWWIVIWLNSIGRDVAMHGLKVAPTRDDWPQFSDHGDFYLGKRERVLCTECGQPRRWRSEVKRLIGSTFTGAHDWPWRDANDQAKIMVTSVKSWDRKDPKPELTFITNDDITHVAIIPTDTFSQWYRERKADRQYSGNRKHWYWFVPPELVTFQKIVIGPHLEPIPDTAPHKAHPRLMTFDYGYEAPGPTMREDEVPTEQPELF
jgi:hypothetical protein